jgi:opacity protein-like surface antigen
MTKVPHLLLFFSLSLVGLAQDSPEWEIHAGYQFTGYQTLQLQTLMDVITASTGSPAFSTGTHLNLNGWDLSVQQNINSWFGGIIDFSGGYGSRSVTLSQPGGKQTGATFMPTLYTIGGGPQFSYRKNERIQPFSRIIAAAAQSDLNPNSSITNALAANAPAPSTSDTAFALIVGGGVDYRLKTHAFLRVAGDYIHTSLFHQGENNFRVTAGIDFRIGTSSSWR